MSKNEWLKNDNEGWYSMAHDIANGFSGDYDVNDVLQPEHYTPEDGDVECIEYIEQVLGPHQFVGYCHGNVTKYLHRYKYKGAPVKDLEKAYVYLGWMIDAMHGRKVRGEK